MPSKQFSKVAADLNARVEAQETELKIMATKLEMEAPPSPFYGPIVRQWKGEDHALGWAYARQLTPESEQWLKKLSEKLAEFEGRYSTDKSGKIHFFENTSPFGDEVEVTASTFSMPVESKASDKTVETLPTDSAKPDFNRLWGDFPVSRAIKEKLNDPDSYKFEDTTDPVKDKHNGVDCWVVVVHFRAKNAFNAVTRNYAYVWVTHNNDRGIWEAIDCQINP
jgi:hypothetical protein